MVTLENEYLKIKVNALGAQLSSIIDKNDGIEHIWQGNPAVWAYQAPNLFPVVGGCINDSIWVNGTPYPIKRHGFARNMGFKKIESSPKHAQFSLRYNDETLKSFPYKFEFQVVYHLDKNQLKVMYKVINLDDKTIYFSLGAHPAFAVPFTDGERYEDYFVTFEQAENPPAHTLSANGFFNGETKNLHIANGNLFLNPDLFKADALVFKNLASRKVSIQSTQHKKSIVVQFPHFNYLGLWAKPSAPFLCVEPWLGCADTEGQATEFSKKEAIQQLTYGHVFETEFFVRIV
ncbi:MAG: aldose 1-epimerase family protein [Sphingobacteriales bacterium]|nr:MAG: aldose 1-epimerase family protein [Sphingobacteriales bacterium]